MDSVGQGSRGISHIPRCPLERTMATRSCWQKSVQYEEGLPQPQPQLLSNEKGGGELLGTGRHLTGQPRGESRQQTQVTETLPTLTVFSLDSLRSLAEGEEHNLISSFPKWERGSPDRTSHPRSRGKAAELGMKPSSAPSQAADFPICFPNRCPRPVLFWAGFPARTEGAMGPAQP